MVHLAGDVQIRQGELLARCDEAIVIVVNDDLVGGTPAGTAGTEEGEDSAARQAGSPDPAAWQAGDISSGLFPASGNRVQRLIVWMEGNVSTVLDGQGGGTQNRIEDTRFWLVRLFSTAPIQWPPSVHELAGRPPGIFDRALAALEREGGQPIRPVQFQEPGPAVQQLVNPLTGEVTWITPQQAAPAWDPQAAGRAVLQGTGPNAPNSSPQPVARVQQSGGQTRVDITARDATVDLNLRIQTNPANPAERIYVATGGVRVRIDSPDLARAGGLPASGPARTATIMADNVIAWQSTLADGDSRWEVYLEGNVVYAQGTRTIHADRMYYDANYQRGTILSADMLTPTPAYDGLVRLRSDVIQQMDANTFEALGPAFTTSRLGVPRYWLQSDRLSITREEQPLTDPLTGRPGVDPYTGAALTREEYFADARMNRVYVADTPVFLWPRYRTSLNDPGLYLDRLRLGNDRILGAQVMTGWNMFQVLGIRNRPENTRWVGVVDYLSKRGLGFGNETDYQLGSFLGLPGTAEGYTRTWFIFDDGLDTLGRGRFNMVPEADRRGNILARHRQRFSPGYSLRAEAGYITDRNFLEQYYERRWDTEKDYTTGLWLERNVGTQSFNVIADQQLNYFFTQTSWLPRLDHFVLGQPLLGNRLVWNAHSSAGYARFRPGRAPLDPTDLVPWDLLAWESADTDSARFTTRHEIQAPLQLGPVKLTPYVLGDVGYWQEALDNNDLLRGYGQTGLRISLPFWRVDPAVQSTLFNVNGLAHKVSLETELLYADASQDLTELPLYDPLDDDAQEAFRHRLAFLTFGLPKGADVPLQYDERLLAYRRGMQSWVTGASPEIADDMTAVRFGARQRWQTKRGLPGRERIIDWITLNTQVSLFPQADRDNFGADWGLFEYDFRWHVGDRVALVSDGFADFFSQGLRTASIGVHAGRPGNGDVYVGFRTIEGPISSNILSTWLQYRLSDKWGVKAGSSFDFSATGSIGHSLSLVYIGESFLWRFGANADTSRDNLGFVFGFEPRFIGRSRLFTPGGQSPGPSGSRWLE